MNSFSFGISNCKKLNCKLKDVKKNLKGLSELYDKNTDSFSIKANEYEK